MNVQLILHIFNLKYIILSILTIKLVIANIEVAKIRGVSVSRANLYDPEKNFTCFDESKTVPFSQVNDDYCDCQDSSDEPGTNACANGLFYCTNAGYKPIILTSDRVNDGICDCCDGSDEYSERKTCVNNCLEIGRAAREAAARLADLLKAGKQLRAELSQEGQKIKNDKQVRIDELKKIKEEAEKVRSEKQELKNEAEAAENKALEYYRELEEAIKKKKAEKEAAKEKQDAKQHFEKIDSNQDGVIEVAEIQSIQTFDKDRNGEVSVEEASFFLNNQESIDFETFFEKSWSLMKPFLKMDSGLYKPPKSESENEEAELEQEESQQEHEEPNDENADGEVVEDHGDNEDEDDDEEVDKVQEDAEDEQIVYDEETQKLVDYATEARNQLADADKSLKDINDQLKEIEESLKKDFGTEEEFATLEGQCFEYKDHEYVYKICPFDKALQIPVSSAMETNLGKWSRWDGPKNNPYSVMLYEHGQNCWNGPNRSTRVKIFCGTENKITSVSEPNRCEYSFDFETPAACKDTSSEETEVGHDEL